MPAAVAQTYRFSVEEFHKLGEAGIFDEDDRVELLDGEIILMSPVGYRHVKAVRRLHEIFSDARRKRYLVQAQDPVIVSDDSEPQPDLLLLAPEVDAYEGLPETRHTFLAVEVADSSLRYDRTRKLRAYARAGIPEFWIVDLKGNRVEVHRDPTGDRYASKRVATPDEHIAPLRFPDVEVPIGTILA